MLSVVIERHSLKFFGRCVADRLFERRENAVKLASGFCRRVILGLHILFENLESSGGVVDIVFNAHIGLHGFISTSVIAIIRDRSKI